MAALASGSGGNALLIEAGGDRLLVDCGLTGRELARRLASLGLAPRDITGLALTHEHGDHVRGAAEVALAGNLPVYGTSGTLRAVVAQAGRLAPGGLAQASTHERARLARLTRPLAAGEPARAGNVTLRPVALPHDAAEPVAYVIEAAGVRVGVATDVGRPTPAVAAALTGLDLLVLEFNHDAGLLADGPYHPALKRRVAGDQGHLSNAEAAELLATVAHAGLEAVWLAHLSQVNNSPDRALAAAQAALRRRVPFEPIALACLAQDAVGPVWSSAGRHDDPAPDDESLAVLHDRPPHVESLAVLHDRPPDVESFGVLHDRAPSIPRRGARS